MDNYKIYPFHFTDYILDWIENNCNKVVFPSFTRYYFTVNEKRNILGILDSNGEFYFYRKNNKKISRRQCVREIKRLMRKNILRVTIGDPFPEYEHYNNILR